MPTLLFFSFIPIHPQKILLVRAKLHSNMAEYTTPNTNPNANYNVGGVGVPGAQVELMENMQPQPHQLLQQQQLQHDYSQQVQQQQQQQSAPVQQLNSQQAPTRDPRQFDQQYQQSFYSQPTANGAIQPSSAKIDAEMAAPAVVPVNTNMVGDGSPGFSVGDVDVPGARVETVDSMQPQAFYQQQQPIQRQQEQYIQQELVAGNAGAPTQQSFFSQHGDSIPTQQQYAQEAAPAHHGIADATNFHVGGFGVPGAQVEYLPAISEQQSAITSNTGTTTKPGELDTVQHASASRPPVGPFDPPAEATTTELAAPPTIFLQREASMRHDQQTPAQTTTATTTTSSTTDATPPHKIHNASSSAVAAAAAAQAADASSRGRRRSSLAVLADKIRSSTSRSRSPSLSRRLSRTISRHSLEDGEDDSAGGPYKDVKVAQQERLAKLRAEQEKNGVTHNIDGLPIPPAPERQRRRSSVGHILGLDKPLLSR
ncbi:MAG: hypothetical protein JOS17DRAFT_750920 [Linnemannia elongata]|nr:MAG: hypothetical protein JOS17DRAFT_750920 [Linnemannia elongata]